jgi:hypothetical protein
MAGNHLSRAILAVESGDKEAARAILASVLRQDPRNADAWRWMAIALDDPDKKRQCWQRVLSLRPGDEQAMKALVGLHADEHPPPVQPRTQTVQPQALKKKRNPALRLVLFAVVVAAVVCGCLCLWIYYSESPETARSDVRNEVAIISKSYRRDSIGSFIIDGEIENQGSHTWLFVELSGSGYDKSGNLVDTGTTYADVERLRPGDKSTFTIYIDEQGRGITKYSVSIIGGRRE